MRKNKSNRPKGGTGTNGRRLHILFLIPVIAFALLAVFSSVALYRNLTGTRDGSQIPSALVGRTAPAQTFPDLRNATTSVSAADFAGRPFLVNVFASWCGPCRAEAPALELLSRDIAIMGIAYKDRESDTLAFLETYGDPFEAIGVDRQGESGIRWGIRGVPETFLVGADGTIILRHAGPIDRRVLDEILLPAIGRIK